jgi:hypothetical protein
MATEPRHHGLPDEVIERLVAQGHILESVAVIDHQLETMLAEYLAADEPARDVLLRSAIWRMPLTEKIDLAIHLAEASSQTKLRLAVIKQRLHELVAVRNTIAHSVLLATEAGDEMAYFSRRRGREQLNEDLPLSALRRAAEMAESLEVSITKVRAILQQLHVGPHL